MVRQDIRQQGLPLRHRRQHFREAKCEGPELLFQQLDLLRNKGRERPALAEKQRHSHEFTSSLLELPTQEIGKHQGRSPTKFLRIDLVRMLQRDRVHRKPAGPRQVSR